MQSIILLAPWVGIFLFFLAGTKLLQTVFVLITDIRNETSFDPSPRNAITIWVSLAYFFTSIVFFLC